MRKEVRTSDERTGRAAGALKGLQPTEAISFHSSIAEKLKMAVDLALVTRTALQRALWRFGIDMTPEHCNVVVELIVSEMSEAVRDCARNERDERWAAVKGQRSVLLS
jgi:hypothetical protein